MILRKASEKLFFAIQIGTGSGKGHEELKIAFNTNIWRDDGLVDLNIFMNVQIPGIGLCKFFIGKNRNSGYF